MITARLNRSPRDEIDWFRDRLEREGFPFFVATQMGQPHSYQRMNEIRAWLTVRNPRAATQRGWKVRDCLGFGIYCVGFHDQILATEFKIHFG
ncbi:hypothetical protein ASF08_10545 [Methylobacterium sp. Leaf85]|nr:hypothetical protein ASF08_10545 [Methylobacterium sp. Leaf85]